MVQDFKTAKIVDPKGGQTLVTMKSHKSVLYDKVGLGGSGFGSGGGNLTGGFKFPPLKIHWLDIYITKYKKSYDESTFDRTSGSKQRNFKIKESAEVRVRTYNVPDQIRIFDTQGNLVDHTDQSIHDSNPRKDIKGWHDRPENFEYIATGQGTVALRVTAKRVYTIVVNQSGNSQSDTPGNSTKTDFDIYIEGKNLKLKHYRIPLLWKPKRSEIHKTKGL